MGRDAFANGFAVVRIIDGFFGPGAEIVDGVAGILQELANCFFDWKSGVIGAEGNAWLARSVGHARLVGDSNGERVQPQLARGVRRRTHRKTTRGWVTMLPRSLHCELAKGASSPVGMTVGGGRGDRG